MQDPIVARTPATEIPRGRHNDPSDFKQEDIDIVYTWVDVTGPGFKDDLQKYLEAEASSVSPLAVSLERFRNNDELRYSLRSVETFAPWVRKIHIITNGQIPQWLDTTNKRVSIVSHDMIFPDKSHLPTYNSNAIELQLHRVPGLSRRFLYLNDDCFLGRAISRSHFITDSGGEYVYFEPIPVSSNVQEGSVLTRSYAYTQEIVERLWGRKGTRFLPAHVPQMYDKEILAHLENLLAKEFRQTSSHRFRAQNDLVLRILYFFYLLESKEQAGKGHEAKFLEWVSNDYSLLMLENRLLKMWRAFFYLLRRRPRFFCVNDDLGDVGSDNLILCSLRIFFRAYFLRSSSFERK